MPRFDGTGPQGQGSMTGRGLGPCGGVMRMDRGCFGRGMRGMFFRQPTKEEQITDTKEYLDYLKTEVENCEKYLEELGTK